MKFQAIIAISVQLQFFSVTNYATNGIISVAQLLIISLSSVIMA